MLNYLYSWHTLPSGNFSWSASPPFDRLDVFEGIMPLRLWSYWCYHQLTLVAWCPQIIAGHGTSHWRGEWRLDTGILHSHPTHYFTLYKYLQLTFIKANWPDISNPELEPNTGCTRLGKRWYFDTLTSALVWCSSQCSAPVALTRRRRCITAQ